MYLAVSFYTKDTPYEQEIEKLGKSLERFNIDYAFYPTDSFGNHVKNGHNKPQIIHKAMIQHPDRNIAWFDADCVVLNNPDKFDELDKLEHDFAATFMWGRYSRQPLIDGWKVNAHCMFFRNNEKMRSFCSRWAVACAGSTLSDQGNLMRLLSKDTLDVCYLPMQYVKKCLVKGKDEVYQVIQHEGSYKNQWVS